MPELTRPGATPAAPAHAPAESARAQSEPPRARAEPSHLRAEPRRSSVLAENGSDTSDTAARLARLRAHVREHAENRPGVYRIYGPGGAPIYVGKSIRVRGRLLSYFRAPRGEKAAEIARHAERVAWDYVNDEFAALLRELRLIRAWRPPFNVQGKAQRALCFVQLTGGPAPRLDVRARPVPRGGGPCFGPFQGRGRTDDAVRDLVDVLGLRTCALTTPLRFADQADLFGHRGQPLCWRADTGRCLAPCAAGCTESDYRRRIEQASDFLAGRTDAPLRVVQRQLDDAAASLNFEYAAVLRDRLARLDWLRRAAMTARDDLTGLSFVYPITGWQGARWLYLIRQGWVADMCQAPAGRAGKREIARRVRRVFHRPATPIERVPADRIAEMLLVARWFRLHPEEREKARGPEGYVAQDR